MRYLQCSSYLLFLFSAWIFKCLPGVDTECDVVTRMPGPRSWRWRIGDSGDQLMWGHGHTNNQRRHRGGWTESSAKVVVSSDSRNGGVRTVVTSPSTAQHQATLLCPAVCYSRHICCVPCAQLESVLTHSHLTAVT